MEMCRKLFSLIEIVVGLQQMAGAFFDTSLLMLVQDRSINNQTNPATSGNRTQQHDDISRFFMIYLNLLRTSSLPLTYYLSDRGDKDSNRKVTICVPLLGYLVSRPLLLFVILFDWPLEVMFATALVNGLTGGSSTFRSGVMAFASDTSSQEKRSSRLNRVKLAYGAAAMLGSIASGHLFIYFTTSHDLDAGLMVISFIFYLLTCVCSVWGLKSSPNQTQAGSSGYGRLLDEGHQESDDRAPDGAESENTTWDEDQGERSRLLGGLSDPRTRGNPQGDGSVDKTTIGLLFAAGVLYHFGLSSALDVLPIFVLKEPLNWNAVWVGYGNATGYALFLTSFLGVLFFSKWLKDTSLIVMGMVSFSTGMLIMAFVEWTFLYFIARIVMIFALIPLPTIRSVISKQIKDTSYGKWFGLLEICLTISGVIASTVFHSVYGSTKDVYPSICFGVSTAISCLAIIPIIMVERRLSSPPRFPEN
ncbi:LOW QUALITY PROTEIN: thymic stromal cotransporter homolog [Scyliorhinus canicula]|uniref:LOW QUALITY PROTEIN: thymic stromal cotransporter homolog n=1 Tax=Scyliorhinus canicula TaxID=7830 RepID=UPI0018F32173|nr:LOW QUALITY PROTEIN: thymic stromal cotransporter homolog [Scyliorhinus canicula]